MTVVGRFDRPDGRFYVDPVFPEYAYLSVTSVLGETTGKAFLQDWAAKLAAEFAVDELDLVVATKASAAGRTGAVDLVKGAARRSRERKADVGSYVHDVIEALIVGGDIPPIPEHLDGKTVDYDGEDVVITKAWIDTIVDGFLAFVSEFDVEFEMAEATVVNRTRGYAGTLDIIALLRALRTEDGRPTRALIDVKTGSKLDKTIHEQLVAYEEAEEVWLDDIGSKAPMPHVDTAAVLHLRTSYSQGFKLLERYRDETTFPRFLGRLRQAEELRAAPNMTGRPLYPSLPDGSQPAPLVEDVDVEGFNPYRKKLTAAGIVRLDQLAAMRKHDVTGIKGLGPKAPEWCEKALARYGLAFADAPGRTPTVNDVVEAAVPYLDPSKVDLGLFALDVALDPAVAVGCDCGHPDCETTHQRALAGVTA